MATPASTGSYLDRMREGIEMSERNRHLATQRNNKIHDEVRQEITARDAEDGTETPEHVIRTDGDRRAGSDWFINTKISREQWGHRLVTMYALAHLAEAAVAIFHQLEQLTEEQRTTNRLLQRLVDQSDV